MAVMLCGWEGIAGLVETNVSLLSGLWTYVNLVGALVQR